jgi:hypothetical protein
LIADDERGVGFAGANHRVVTHLGIRLRTIKNSVAPVNIAAGISGEGE